MIETQTAPQPLDYSLIQGLLDGLRPIRRLTVSEWADQYRILAQAAASEPGQWRTDRTPYLREIMDKLSAPDPCQKIVFVKGAQVGGTEAANNWIGYIIDNAPAPTLMVMPTDETVKRNSKMRIDPMIEATPSLKEKIGPAKSRDGTNNTYQKEFPGGVLVMTGANSAVGLRSMPIRFLFLDEVDGYPLDLDGEGSPVDLATARTRTFANRKIFLVSTPTVQHASVIEKEFFETDQRYYFVPCSECGHRQQLVLEQLKWPQGKPSEARYECIACGHHIEERFKTAMLRGGDWVATKPENSSPTKVGYHLNSLYSPYGWYSWADAAADYEAALKDPMKMKTFQNTVLGKTWAEKGDAPDWELLYDRRSDYQTNRVPSEVCFLTAGVDCQADRLELEIVGWCKGKRSYSIDYRILLGRTSEQAVWDELAKVVNETWEREDGALLPLAFMCVDSGFNTSTVYNFCRKFSAKQVGAIKGQESQKTLITTPSSVDVNLNGKKVGRTHLWNIGVSLAKEEIYAYLKGRIDPETGEVPIGYCQFPQYPAEYFKGLTAEQLQSKTVRGFQRFEWVKTYQRNEPLDCRVYARAAAEIVGLSRYTDGQLDKLSATYIRKAQGPTVAPKPTKRKKSSNDFW